MRIEQMLHSIDSNVKFRKMRNNLNILESKAFGSRYIRIGSPENLERMIERARQGARQNDRRNPQGEKGSRHPEDM